MKARVLAAALLAIGLGFAFVAGVLDVPFEAPSGVDGRTWSNALPGGAWLLI